MAHNADTRNSRDSVDEDAPSQEPITSRFLFVDVAAQRAKQLRRGALVRLDRAGHTPHKLERIAMEEVRTGLIGYELPTSPEAYGKTVV
jgi:DNA-directed RNA polymerase subunit K/omega